MKSAIAATLLLVGLVLTCWWISGNQEKAVAPILEKIVSINTTKTELNDQARQNALAVIKQAKEDFENRNFTVEIGVPQKEVKKIELGLDKAAIYLSAKEDALFFSQIIELCENLSTLKNYGKISFKNIT